MFGGTAQHPLHDDCMTFLDLPLSQVAPYPTSYVNLEWILIFSWSYSPVFRETDLGFALLYHPVVGDEEHGGKCLQQELRTTYRSLNSEGRSFCLCAVRIDQVKGGNTELKNTHIFFSNMGKDWPLCPRSFFPVIISHNHLFCAQWKTHLHWEGLLYHVLASGDGCGKMP